MAQYTTERLKKAVAQAVREGNIEAANEFASLYESTKAQEKADFVSYEPTKAADVLPSIGEGLKGSIETLKGGYDETIDLLDKDVIEGRAGVPLMLTKSLLPAAGEVVTTGLKTAGQALSLAIPDFVEDYTIEGLSSIAYDISETPFFQEGLEAASQGYSKFLKFKDNHPAEAEYLSSGFDISLMGLPASKVPPVTDTLDKWSWNKTNAGRLQGIEQRRDIVSQILAPVKLEKKDISRTDTKGLLGRITTTPDPLEQEVISVVSLIPAVKGSNNPVKNANAVLDEINATAERLIKRLKLKGNPTIDTKGLNASMDAEVAKYFAGNAAKVSIASPKKMQAILDEAKKLILTSDGTATGILQARKDLDKWLDGIDPKMVNDEYMDSKAKALKIIREAMNNAVGDAVPDVDVKGLLRKQYLMYKAYDNLGDKAMGMAKTSLARSYINAKRVTGTAMPTTPLAMAATASAASAAISSGWFAFATGTLALGTGAVLTSRMLKGPTAKKGLGVLLGQVSKAIKMSKSKEMIEQLKADRLVIISLLEQPQDETQRIPMKGAGNA
tara:strand:- start:1961 stop:3631 length:1671 start_codon:yes stop_codon:yes gene_type:complete